MKVNGLSSRRPADFCWDCIDLHMAVLRAQDNGGEIIVDGEVLSPDQVLDRSGRIIKEVKDFVEFNKENQDEIERYTRILREVTGYANYINKILGKSNPSIKNQQSQDQNQSKRSEKQGNQDEPPTVQKLSKQTVTVKTKLSSSVEARNRLGNLAANLSSLSTAQRTEVMQGITRLPIISIKSAGFGFSQSKEMMKNGTLDIAYILRHNAGITDAQKKALINMVNGITIEK